MRPGWVVVFVCACGSVKSNSPGDAPTAPDDVALPASCMDGMQNNDETAVDCGGTCAPCSNGSACTTGSDCASGSCPQQVCAACTGVSGGCAAGFACYGGACQTAKRACRDILMELGTAPDGTYLIDPDLAGPGAPFQAYCDMTTGGGGWTLVFQNAAASSAPNSCTAGAIGFLDLDDKTVSATAKLSDTLINQLWTDKELLGKTTEGVTTFGVVNVWQRVSRVKFVPSFTWDAERVIPLPTDSTGLMADPMVRYYVGGPDWTVQMCSTSPGPCNFLLCDQVTPGASYTRVYLYAMNSAQCPTLGANWAGSTTNCGQNISKWFLR